MTPKEAYKLAYMWHRWLMRGSGKEDETVFRTVKTLFYKHGFGRQWEAAQLLMADWIPF